MCAEKIIRVDEWRITQIGVMIALLWLVTAILVLPFKSKWRLEVENAALRHQVIVLRRQARGRIHLTNLDRLLLVQLYRWFPSILRTLAIVQPATVIRWRGASSRRYWPVLGKMRRSLARVQQAGNIKSRPILGGLHYHYIRV